MQTTSRTRRALVMVAGAATMVAAVAAAPVGAATASADIGVTLARSASLAEAGDTITYTATVTNAGPDTATGVVLLDPLGNVGRVTDPAGVTTTAGSCSIGQYNALLVCQLGSIPASGSVTVTVPVQQSYAGVIENTVAVGATSDDANAANDRATTSVVVDPGPSYQERLAIGYFELLIGRKPTSTELTTWSTEFTRQRQIDVVGQLTRTNSARLRWIDAQFRRYLGRSSGAGGQHFLGVLNRGGSYDQVVSSILSSREFARSVTSTCQDGTCVDYAPTAWLEKAYFAATGDAMPAAYRDALYARYGGSPSYAAAATIVKSAQARRKYVDVLVRQYQHHPATNFQLYVGVSQLTKRQITAEGEQVSILNSYDVYGPWVEGCCNYYYPGYYGPQEDQSSSTTAAAASPGEASAPAEEQP